MDTTRYPENGGGFEFLILFFWHKHIKKEYSVTQNLNSELKNDESRFLAGIIGYDSHHTVDLMWAFPPAAGSTMRAQSTGPSGQQSRGSVAYYTRLCLEAIASISINCL